MQQEGEGLQQGCNDVSGQHQPAYRQSSDSTLLMATLCCHISCSCHKLGCRSESFYTISGIGSEIQLQSSPSSCNVPGTDFCMCVLCPAHRVLCIEEFKSWRSNTLREGTKASSVTILYAYGASRQTSHTHGLGPPWAIALNPAQSNLDNPANLNLSWAI